MIDFRKIYNYSQEYFPFAIYHFLAKYKFSQDYERKENQNRRPINGKSLILKRVKPLSNELQ